MRFPSLVLALAGAVALAISMTGCSSLVWLNQFATDEDAALDQALAGAWSGDNGNATYVIKLDGSGYAITYMEKSDAGKVQFQARLLKAGDAELLDLVSADDNPFELQVHTAVRVWPSGNSLKFAFLDSDWLKQQAAKQLATSPTGDRMLVTSPGDAVRSFLLKYGADEKAHGDPEVLARVQ
jgi:hypothetical protein